MESQFPVSPQEFEGLYSGRHVRDAVLLLLTGTALYFCWRLARPFLAGITWALALAVVAYPLHCRLERWFAPSPAALLSVLVIVIVLLAPSVLLVHNVMDEAGSLEAVAKHFNSGRLQETAHRFPFPARVADWLAERLDLNEALKRFAGTLASQASALLRGSVRLLTQIVIMLVTLFYFLRDRKHLLEYLRRLVPLAPVETDRVFLRVSKMIHATLYGNVVVKLVQGVLGGAIFWALGLSAPILCGIAMALFAMIPVAGTSFVWGPAAIFLLIQGSWVKALLLTLWGTLVVSLVDNFLYPILIASELRIHTLAILFAILGGISAFGLAGVVLGPVVLASTTALLEVWRRRAECESERSEQCHV